MKRNRNDVPACRIKITGGDKVIILPVVNDYRAQHLLLMAALAVVFVEVIIPFHHDRYGMGRVEPDTIDIKLVNESED